jgi:hypothetical protein
MFRQKLTGYLPELAAKFEFAPALFFFEIRLENDAILLNCATNSIRKSVKCSTLQKDISFMSQNYLFFVFYFFFVNLCVNLFMLRILLFNKLLVRQYGLQVLIWFHLQLLILSVMINFKIYNFFPSNTFQSVKRWSYFLYRIRQVRNTHSCQCVC